jgi:hypothetical protein
LDWSCRAAKIRDGVWGLYTAPLALLTPSEVRRETDSIATLKTKNLFITNTTRNAGNGQYVIFEYATSAWGFGDHLGRPFLGILSKIGRRARRSIIATL